MTTAVRMVATTTSPTVTRVNHRVTLPPFHAGQERARRALRRCRFLVLYCGRRWGKTRFAATVAIAEACGGGRVWWVSPTYPMASIAWRLLRFMVRDFPAVAVRESERMITFPGGGYLQVKSADNPDGLRGEGLDLAVLDEAAYMQERVWTEAIRPTLSDRGGRAIFATTPAGMNWMHDLFMLGQGDDAEWLSLRFKTADNPFIPASEIASARAGLPAPIFAQEYEAEPGAGDRGVIPLAWVLAANDRWRAWQAAGAVRAGPCIAACDVSEGGDGADTCALALRHGWVIADVLDVTPARRGDMLPIGDRIAAELAAYPGGYAVIDAVGVGAMMPSYVTAKGGRAIGYKGGHATKLRDPSGMFGFTDTNAAAWWHFRSLLDPETGPGVALPPSRRLTQGLTIRQYEERAGNTIAIERKKSLNPRLGYSPDDADAVVMAFWDRMIMRGRGG